MLGSASDAEVAAVVDMSSLNDALAEVLRSRGYRVLAEHATLASPAGSLTESMAEHGSSTAAESPGAVLFRIPAPADGASDCTNASASDCYAARIHEDWMLDDWAIEALDGLDPGTRHGRTVRAGRTRARRTLLNKSLAAIGSAPRLPLTAYLNGEAFPLDAVAANLGYRALYAAALHGWVADRTAAGYTPEATQVMLALLTPPHLCDLLDLDLL